MENINLDKIIKPDELDYNMILSVPEEIGIKLQKIIQGNATINEKNSTDIQIIENPNEKLDMEESRKLIYNDHLLPITILDLPCIIEAQKSIDYKTFYKSSDISQMMFVHDFPFQINEEKDIERFNPFESGDEYFKKLIWKKDPDHKYKLKHGLAKSTRNIRERRFKAKTRYNQEEILEVAKKLKSIIDNGAANFENQMKNMQESVQDDESITNKFMDNQSEIQSEKNINYPQKGGNKPSLKSSFNKHQAILSNNNNKINSSSNININQNNINPTNFSINLNSKISEINQNNENITNKTSNKKSSKKTNKNINDIDNFAVPPSKKIININSNANKFNNNNSFNISLNLAEPVNEIDNIISNQGKNKKKISLMEKNNSSFILPLNEENPFSKNVENKDDESDNENEEQQYFDLTPEEKKLKEEYDSLKEEYNKIKSFLDSNKSGDKTELKEKEKLKKKIKKRLKQIKEVFKEKVKK